MKKLMMIALLLCASSVEASHCMQPLRPMPTMKPMWCQGRWVQVLRCDQNCNCMWQETCFE